MTRRWRAVALACLTAAVLGSAEQVAAEITQAGPVRCNKDFCVDDQLGANVPARRQTGSARHRPSRGGPPPECVWVRADPSVEEIAVSMGVPSARPSPDAYPLWRQCNGQWNGEMRWSQPAAAAPAPPSPEDIAWRIYVRLEGELPAPVVASDPPLGDAAVLRRPVPSSRPVAVTFVEVANWTGRRTDRECVGLLCVTVISAPALTFVPGEPNAHPVTCTGAGTRFDPAGPPSIEQASVSGACAHAYQLRTGAAAGRPDAWPGTVNVTWTLSWSSTTGRSGSLPSITKSADVPRAVHEVPTVVEE